MGAPPATISKLQADALAAADALRSSEKALVELLRDQRRRREFDGRPLTPDEERAERRVVALIEVAAAVAGAVHLDDLLEVAAQEALVATGASSVAVSRWEH